MKKYLPLLALIVAFSAIALLKELSTGKLNYPLMVTEIDGDIRMTVLNHGQKSAEQCAKQLSSLTNVTQVACPQCKIIESICLKQLNQQQQEWLQGTAPATSPLALTQQGIIFYQAATPANALIACQATEAQALTSPRKFTFICLPPGQTRPAGFGITENQKSTEGNFNLLLKGIATIVTLLLALIIATKFISKKAGGRTQQLVSKLTLAGGDLLVMLSAIALLAFPDINDPVSMKRFDTKELLTYITLTFLTVAWFWIALEHYARRRPFWDELRETLKVVSVLILLGAATIFYGGIDIGRGRALWVWGSLLILLPLGRSAAKQLLDVLGLWKTPAVIIGTGENAMEAYLAIRQEHGMGYDLKYFVNQDSQISDPREIVIGKETFPVACTDDLIEFLAQNGRPQVIVALESLANNNSQLLIQQLTSAHHNIHVIPSIRGLPLFGTELSHFFSHEVLFLTVRNNLARRSQQITKRLFDMATASLLLILLAPVFITLIILIRKSGGPAFYGHPRVGRYGQPFKCLKFRSMRPDADKILKELLANDPAARAEWEKDFKLKNDPRITPVGHFLRKTSLDELPQVLNVLKGEMSLVGPRPVVKDELERYGAASSLYLEAKPGITGLWQVSGRNDTTYAERVSLDSWYVQNWSLWYDIAILFKTVDVVLLRKGAY
jgi:undecaprenyl-phosphate galactose phosphotransferase